MAGHWPLSCALRHLHHIPAISTAASRLPLPTPAGSSSHPGPQRRPRARRPASSQVCGCRRAATRGVGAAAIRVVVSPRCLPPPICRVTARALILLLAHSASRSFCFWPPTPTPTQLLPQLARHVHAAGCGRHVPALRHGARNPAVSMLRAGLQVLCPARWQLRQCAGGSSCLSLGTWAVASIDSCSGNL